MKIKSVELERRDIATLFSDGTYHSPLSLYMVGTDDEINEFYQKEEEEHPGICDEDIWADWLLNGGSLKLDGNECYEGDEEYDTDLVGTFNLEKFNRRINEALNDKDVAWNVTNLIEENDDFCTGFNLLQYVAFDEIILG